MFPDCPGMSDPTEFLYQALASPKGIILETDNQSVLMLSLIEAKKLVEDFASIKIVAPAGRPTQVWLVKDENGSRSL